MNVTLSGLPAIVIQVGFVVVFAAPVWLAGKIVGARNPTMFRSIAALTAGVIGSVVSVAVAGAWALLLAPVSFLLSFKFLLGTSIFGALLLGILTIAGYAAMVHFIGGGLSFSGGGAAV